MRSLEASSPDLLVQGLLAKVERSEIRVCFRPMLGGVPDAHTQIMSTESA